MHPSNYSSDDDHPTVFLHKKTYFSKITNLAHLHRGHQRSDKMSAIGRWNRYHVGLEDICWWIAKAGVNSIVKIIDTYTVDTSKVGASHKTTKTNRGPTL